MRAEKSVGSAIASSERVGVQRLGAAQHRGHRLDGCAHHVVVRVLLGQRHAAGLAVRAQHLGPLALRAQLRHGAMPQHARGAQLGDFHEEVHADGEEEGQPPREIVEVKARCDAVTCIFDAVGDGEGQFLHLRRARFLHMIAGNGDAVELGHFAAGITEDVRNDPHRRFGRVDISVADHELLEDVVLDRSVEQLAIDALLLARDDEESEHGDDRPVHRHGHRHLVERDAVEQDLHVLDRVDRDARLADIAHHARMVAVITAMSREVEGDRQTLLPGGKVPAIESVGFLGCRKARILADRPGPPGIHRCAHAAREGRKARQAGSTVTSSAV